MIFMGDDAAGG